MFDALDKLPVWQRILAWILESAILVSLWYFVFYTDAVEARDQAIHGIDEVHSEEGGNVDRARHRAPANLDRPSPQERFLLLGPGLATVLGVVDLAEFAHDPAGVGIDELDRVEDRVSSHELFVFG